MTPDRLARSFHQVDRPSKARRPRLFRAPDPGGGQIVVRISISQAAFEAIARTPSARQRCGRAGG